MRVRMKFGGVVLVMAARWASASVVAPGDLVILQSMGDSDVAAQTAVPVSMVEFSTVPNSAAIQTINVPTAGDARLTIGASTGTEGLLTYNDGYIGIAGYDAAPGTASVFAGVTNSPRRMLGYDVTQDLAADPQFNAITTLFNNGNFRSVIYSSAAGGAYGIGAINGIIYQTNGATSGGINIVSGGPGTAYGIGIFNGNTYISTQNATHGIYGVTGTPTTAGNAISLDVPTPASTNSGTAVNGYNFWISPDGSTAYLAEETDTASAANGGQPTGGIKKYVKGTDGFFSLAYTINTDYDGVGGAVTGVRSIAVDDSGIYPVLYATSSDRLQLLAITDTGTADGAASTLSILQTAATGDFIRSVVLVPHLAGDADDNGVLNPDDYTLIDRGFNLYNAGQIAVGQAMWKDGDFNHDGMVDSADYLIIDTHYAMLHGNQLDPAMLNLRAAEFGTEYVQSLLAAVPEPSSLWIMAMICSGLVGHRRAVATRSKACN